MALYRVSFRDTRLRASIGRGNEYESINPEKRRNKANNDSRKYLGRASTKRGRVPAGDVMLKGVKFKKRYEAPFVHMVRQVMNHE